MQAVSPARAGFDRVLRRPSLIVAEVAWRWCFGVAALGLVAATCILFLDTIQISAGDQALMKAGTPFLAADALAHILAASKAPLLRALAVLVPGIAILWTIAAALGRLVTIPALLDAAPVADRRVRRQHSFRSLLAISFLRAALALAALGGYVGAALIAGRVSGLAETQNPSLFLIIFLPVIFVDLAIWAMLNWFLSVAPLFVIRDGHDAQAACTASVQAFRDNPRDFTAAGTVFGIARLAALAAVTVLGFVLIGAGLPGALLTAAVIVITLAYFVVADVLYLARLGAYAVLLEQDAPVVATVER